MNNEEAKEYATKMSYTDAIYNLLRAKSVPYRKATFMKINELLSQMECSDCISRETVRKLPNYCQNCGAKIIVSQESEE